MASVTPNYKSIKSLLKDEKFTIDDYQREYKWGKSNIVELLDDLETKFMADYHPNHQTQEVSNYSSYFLGSIIVSKRDGKNYLVDGQQRTTSLTLLLIFLYHKLKEKNSSVTSTVETLIYSDDYGQPSFNLDIEERLPVLEGLFKNKDIDTENLDESLQNMVERYKDIESEFSDELLLAVEHFTYWLIGKVGVIEISTDNDEYAYTIFETMNDRGKPLSPVDMLKAYLLANIISTKDRHNANTSWKETIQTLLNFDPRRDTDIDSVFIKSWIRAQYGKDTRERKANSNDKDWENIGNAFHRWIRDNKKDVGLVSSDDYKAFMTETFPFYSKAYSMILEASKQLTPGLESIFYNAINDFTLQQTILLAPLTRNDDQEMRRKKMQVVATYLDIFVVRRVINYIRVNYSSIQYTMVQLIKEIRHKSLEELVDILTERLNHDDITFENAKGGERKGLNDLRYNMFSKRYIHYILARMTSWIEIESGMQSNFMAYVNRTKESAKNPFEVEHLVPDNYNGWSDIFANEDTFNSFRNSFAALVLLPKSKNASYNDTPYGKKVDHYLKENLLAASLSTSIYENNTRFNKFRTEQDLNFKAYKVFTPIELAERQLLYKNIVEKLWGVDRLKQEAGI